MLEKYLNELKLNPYADFNWEEIENTLNLTEQELFKEELNRLKNIKHYEKCKQLIENDFINDTRQIYLNYKLKKDGIEYDFLDSFPFYELPETVEIRYQNSAIQIKSIEKDSTVYIKISLYQCYVEIAKFDNDFLFRIEYIEDAINRKAYAEYGFWYRIYKCFR